MTDRSVLEFRRNLLAWGRKNRRSFPWRETDDPFRVLVAEVLLQRSRGKSEDRIEPAVWWLTYGGRESPYKDVPGQEYQFGQRLRAGKKVQTGDFAIEYRRAYGGARGQKRLWAKDEILGIGRIGRVDEIVGAKKKTENRRAVFAHHHAFDPPILVETMDVTDMRDRTQNSIKDGTDAEFDALVSLAGLPDPESLPLVGAQGEDGDS